MIVKRLELNQFRNYESLDLSFDPHTNIIFGKNGQGKTNILEAVFMSSTSRSHRGSRDREMIRFGQREAHIRTTVWKDEQDIQIDLHLRSSKSKGIAINRVPIHRAADLFGILNAVVFSPEDLQIIKNGPQERRSFLNQSLSQLDKVYLHDLSMYHKALGQRNQLLKDSRFEPSLLDTLDIWDEQVLQYGIKIIRRREAFVDDINTCIVPIHREITGGKEQIQVIYEKNTEEKDFRRQLERMRERDLKEGTTHVGPHRDDLRFEANGMDMRTFGSQGQQRTCALSLKLSSIQIMENALQETPVLLLDDVLSELDSARQNLLLQSIQKIQTIITCTGYDDFIKNRFHLDKVFEVEDGKVFERS